MLCDSSEFDVTAPCEFYLSFAEQDTSARARMVTAVLIAAIVFIVKYRPFRLCFYHLTAK